MAFDPDGWSLGVNAAVFLISALVIGVFGVRLVRVADNLAERTGLGGAIFGALFVGGSTSVSGLVTSVTAAAGGMEGLAISNAVGGIAGQTAMLAVADMAYRKANLEHASASVANLLQAPLLVALLTMPILAMAGPEIDIWAIHPISIASIALYIGGLYLVSKNQERPMWSPRLTVDTVREGDREDESDHAESMAGLWARFVVFVAPIAIAGWVLARVAPPIGAETGLSETVVGGLFTALATSIPELVVAVAAVRRGAVSLAVGDIIGGNTFDTLFIAVSDIAYRSGSIYHVMDQSQLFLIALTMLMTSVLLMGLIGRETHGFANIGWESSLMLLLYVGGFALLLLG